MSFETATTSAPKSPAPTTAAGAATPSELAFEHKLTRMLALAFAPALLLGLYLLWSHTDWSAHARVFVTVIVLASTLYALCQVPEKLRTQWRSLSNVVEAVKSGDFGLRALHSRDSGAYGELVRELNQLSAMLQQQRLHALETQTLLAKVIREIDVAIFAFDQFDQLSLVNPAALKLLGGEESAFLKKSAAELGLSALLSQPPGVLHHRFPAGDGLWGVRTESFIEHGAPQTLLFVADLQQVLRAEELKAWQRLIRVLSHEVNNSLTPIASASMSLQTLLKDDDINAHREDFADALGMMQERSSRLREFIRRYADWSKLPPPNRRIIVLQEIWSRLPVWNAQAPVQFSAERERLELFADPAQLEQCMINLLKNAYEAQAGAGLTAEQNKSIECHASVRGNTVHIAIRDHGPGLANTTNLFVPFYSTKADGSGIGLMLCRQIAEAHGGSLSLRNCEDGSGAIAELVLPFQGGAAA